MILFIFILVSDYGLSSSSRNETPQVPTFSRLARSKSLKRLSMRRAATSPHSTAPSWFNVLKRKWLILREPVYTDNTDKQ